MGGRPPGVTPRTNAPQTIRVASVPADHPYIRHLGSPGADDGVVRLGDERAPGQRGWWPPRMLECEWVEANASEFDLFHIQFGYDGRHPDQLRELCALLREHRKPLVYSVHDLRNPNHESQGLHAEQLEVLISAAAELTTLTEKARGLIAERFDREAVVIPHPHVLPLDLLDDELGKPPGRPPTVGVHLKSLRSNMTAVDLVEALSPPPDSSYRFRVDLHTEVWDHQAPAFRADLRCSLEHLERRDGIDLRVHEYFSDSELYQYLASLDVAVLPYKFGTHSGWIEACRDVGTAVVVPDCGCYEDQGPAFVYHLNERDGLGVESLRAAVGEAVAASAGGRVRPYGAAARRRQRNQIAAAHRRLYERALEQQAAAPTAGAAAAA